MMKTRGMVYKIEVDEEGNLSIFDMKTGIQYGGKGISIPDMYNEKYAKQRFNEIQDRIKELMNDITYNLKD